MSDEGSDQTVENDDRQPQPHRTSPERIDAVSVIVGLLFIAIALLALADRFWTKIDPVLVTGGAVIAVGVAMFAGVIVRRARHSEQNDA